MPAVGEWAQRGVIVVPPLRQLWAELGMGKKGETQSFLRGVST
jgi:hypothetical protein